MNLAAFFAIFDIKADAVYTLRKIRQALVPPKP